ncbi:MAG: ATPase [Vallitaleaceae bacterium]|nr:ATPase [Vallitaleaceae bacterium]
MAVVIVLALLLVLSTVGVGIYLIKNELEGKKVRRFLGVNISAFFTLMIVATIALLSGSNALAADVVAGAPNVDGFKFLGAALATGLGSIGTGIAVAATGSAAIGAISENEKLLGKTVIFVGLAEGIAIYGLIISIMILGQ